jgi:hypothetical protein
MLCDCCRAIDLRKYAKELFMQDIAQSWDEDSTSHNSVFRNAKIPYHSTLTAMLSAISQGCEVCNLLLKTYEEHNHLSGSFLISTPIEDSAKVLAQRGLSLDSQPRLKFATTHHHSVSLRMLAESDPACKEATKKSLREAMSGRYCRATLRNRY